MDSKTNIPTYLIEKPSDQDTFLGAGHQHAANAIVGIIQNQPNFPIIGLEGGLGAGKSTVIELLNKLLPPENYHISIFNVDTHSHSSIKAALIKQISVLLLEWNAQNELARESVKDAKNRALGNAVSYTKEVNSHIKWDVVLAIISIMAFVRYGPESISIVFNTIAALFPSVPYTPSVSATVKAIFGLSPLLCAGWIAFQNKKRSDNKKTNWGNIFKRNGLDKIDESWEITREVGSTELAEALQVFGESIPNDKTLLLVIDDLDRVEARLVKEIWSDLNTLSSLAGDKIRIIVPFSESHIAKALSDDDDEAHISGREYIAKRLPLVFRAPPVLTAGWRVQFSEYWEEAIGFIHGQEETAKIIDLWILRDEITPRLLKRIINEIATAYISTPGGVSHGLPAAVYNLLYRHQRANVNLQTLLSLSDSTSSDGAYVENKLSVTQELMTKTLGGIDKWATEIACIHYQTSEDNAYSELLVEPIQAAFNGQDGESILSLSKVVGFEFFFKGAVEDVTPESAYNLLSAVNDLDSDIAESFICEWLPFINQYAKTYSSPMEPNESMGFLKLVDESDFELEMCRLESSYNTFYECQEISEDQLVWLHTCSRILDKIPSKVRNPSADFFIYMLWPGRSDYTYWDVESISLSPSLRYEIVRSIDRDESEGLDENRELLAHLNSINRLGSMLKFEALPTSDRLHTLALGEIEYFPYSEAWKVDATASTLITSFLEYRDSISEDIEKDECARIISALLVYGIKNDNLFVKQTFPPLRPGKPALQMSVYETIEKYLDGSETLVSNMIDFLTHCRFGQLLDALEVSQLHEFVSLAIKQLVHDDRVHSLKVDEAVAKYDDLLGVCQNSEMTICWLSDWAKYFTLDLNELSERFIRDIFEFKQSAFTAKVEDKFWTILTSQEKMASLLKGEEKTYFDNVLQIADILIREGKQFENYKVFSDFLCECMDAEDPKATVASMDLLKQLIKLLPEDQKILLSSRCTANFVLSQTTNKQRIFMIDCFGDRISLPQSEVSSTRHAYIQLFGEDSIRQWLVDQSWELERWTVEELQALSAALQDGDSIYKPILLRAHELLPASTKFDDEAVETEDQE